MISRRWIAHPLLPAVMLIGFMISRLHDLLAFPMFLDEGLVLQWAHDSLQGKVLSFAQYGRVLPSWWLALFGSHIGTLFSGRAAHLLISLIGAAAIYGLARRFGGIRAAWIILVIVIFSPMLFFFDRMLIPDAMGLALTALTLWLMSDPRFTMRNAVLVAISLTAAIFTRATLIVLLIMPLLTVLLLIPASARRWRWLGIVYGGTAVLCVPLLLLFYLHGQNYFLGFTVKGSASVGRALSGPLLANVSLFLSAWLGYWGTAFAIGLTICIVIGLLIGGRRAWWLGGASIPLIGAISIFGSDVTVRYFLVGILPLLLIGVIGMVKLIDRIGNISERRADRLYFALAALILIWIITWALPFQLTAYRTPVQLALPASDQQEYMAQEPAGFGIRDAAAAIRQRAADKPIRVIGWLSACSTLQNYLAGLSTVTVECPQVHLTYQGNATLIAGTGKRVDDPNPPLVISENLAVLPDSALPDTRILIASFPRPDNGRSVQLWQLR